MRPARAGSGTGRAASTDHSAATSATVRANGPTVSNDGQSGKTPSIGTTPWRVLRPTISQAAAGSLTEHPVSVPMPRSQRPAAIAAALPLEEPPVVSPGLAGLCTVPYHSFVPSTPHANSARFALPSTDTPASSTRSTTVAFLAGTWSA